MKLIEYKHMVGIKKQIRHHIAERGQLLRSSRISIIRHVCKQCSSTYISIDFIVCFFSIVHYFRAALIMYVFSIKNTYLLCLNTIDNGKYWQSSCWGALESQKWFFVGLREFVGETVECVVNICYKWKIEITSNLIFNSDATRRKKDESV